MNFTRALPLAEKVRERLFDLCEQVATAGSIRRRRDWVNDIDLVILPKPGMIEEIKSRVRSGCAVVTEGQQNCIYRMPLGKPGEEIQLDLFFARPTQRDLLQTVPGNFGTLLLCRTGSREHNIFLVEHAKRLGLVWRPYDGVFQDGQWLASDSEEAIFIALQLCWIPPGKRER